MHACEQQMVCQCEYTDQSVWAGCRISDYKVQRVLLSCEITLVIITVVYIHPQASEALYDHNTHLKHVYTEALPVLLGNYNPCNLKTVLPKYY